MKITKTINENIMVLKFLILTILLLNLTNKTSSANVQCNYRLASWPYLPGVYECEVSSNLYITTYENTNIDSQDGSHEDGKDVNDVACFFAFNSRTQYIPSGLENVFPNLRALIINHGRIKEIHQLDLKQYSKLTYLDLAQNDIGVLEEGLLSYNAELEFINFDSNHIFQIFPTAFDQLNKLTRLNLVLNNCISRVALGNITAVNLVIKMAITDCQEPKYMTIENKIRHIERNLLNSDTVTFQEFSLKFDQVQNKLNNSPFSQYFTKRIQNLTEWETQKFWPVDGRKHSTKNEPSNADIAAINDKILKLENSISIVDAKIEDLVKIIKDYIESATQKV